MKILHNSIADITLTSEFSEVGEGRKKKIIEREKQKRRMFHFKRVKTMGANDSCH